MVASTQVVDPKMQTQERRILLGRIVGVFGVKGQVKILSWTEPREAIFRYQPWILQSQHIADKLLEGVSGREMGKSLIATIPGIDDRNGADLLRGTEIWVERSVLPPPGKDEYYWVDLEGLSVVTCDGVPLGTVSQIFATGANDVMVVQGDRERMIPFVLPDYIKSVDFESRQVVVDWDPEF